jgi:hypothetical protein
MSGFYFSNGFRRRIPSLLTLAVVLSTSVGLASRSYAQQTATATATVAYSMTGSGWALGRSDRSDDGGNYSSATIAPAGTTGITATIHLGESIAKREGTITVVQHFLLAPYTGTLPSLQYNVHLTVQASVGHNSQTALAQSTHNSPYGDFSKLAIAGQNTMSFSDSGDDSIVWPASGDWSDTSIVYVQVTQPVDAGGPIGGG